MRKFITIIWTFCALSLCARHIEQNEAAAVASAILKTSAVADERVARCAAKGAASHDTPFYIFNASDGKGFAIVAADDRARKILAYSEKGSLDAGNMPPQLQELLTQYSSSIAAISDATPVHRSWREPSDPTPQVLLNTAAWGQGEPYNNDCPYIDEYRAPAGCVATAMAITMKYHGWPEQCRGQYTSGLTGAYADLSELRPDWASLPATTAEMLASPVASANIADLMLAIGTVTDMMYGAMGSGAYDDRIGGAFHVFFKYKMPRLIWKKAPYDERIYSDAEWLDFLYNELDNSRPLIYCASAATERHSFVIDGYAAGDLFHVNWGWDGYSNGYYALTATDGDASPYKAQASMVTGIEPDYDATEACEPVFIAPSAINDGFGLQIDYNTTYGQQYLAYLTGLHVVKGSDVVIAPVFIDKDNNVLGVAVDDYDLRENDNWGDLNVAEGSYSTWYGINMAHPANATAVAVGYRNRTSHEWELAKSYHGLPAVSSLTDRSADYANISYDIDPLLKITYLENKFQNAGYKSLPARIVMGSWLAIYIYTPDGDISGLTVELDGHDITDYCRQIQSSEGDLCYILSGKESNVHLKISLSDEYKANISQVKIGSATYVLHKAEKTATIIADENRTGAIRIPASVTWEGVDYTVTAIGNGAFQQRADVRTVVIPATVTHIADNALSGCAEIEKVEIAEDSQLKEIGDYAFFSTYIKEFYFPATLETIGQWSFAYHKMSTIRLPESLRSIGYNAFASFGQTSIENVYVGWPEPETVQVDAMAFNEVTDERPVRTLYVPVGTRDKYLAIPAWDVFDNIIETNTGLSDIDTGIQGGLISVYDLAGRILYTGVGVPALSHGIYIVRTHSGTRKICL